MGVPFVWYLYAGEQFDPDVGAYYLRARYYSEDTGRFHGMDPADGRMCSPATLNKYTYVENSPLDYVDPSGLMSLGELNTAMNVMGELRGISVRLVLTRKGGKKTTKFIACQVGVAYMEDSIRRDGFEMHHSFNQSFGGAKNQALIALPSNTHHMFHGVLNMFLRADPQFEGLGNWSSKEDWKEWARDNKEARRALYLAVSRAAAMVDRFCELKPPKSLGYFVRRNKRQFLEGE